MQCQLCHKELFKEDFAASISGSIMGDECTDAFYFCPVCRVYSVETWRDNFTGTETSGAYGPLSRNEGDRRIALINTCDSPWDKKCRCEAHRKYFHDALD